MNAKTLKRELRTFDKIYVGCNGYPVTDFCYDKIKKVLYLFSNSGDNTLVSKNELFRYSLRHVWDKAKVLHKIDTDFVDDVTDKINLYSFDF